MQLAARRPPRAQPEIDNFSLPDLSGVAAVQEAATSTLEAIDAALGAHEVTTDPAAQRLGRAALSGTVRLATAVSPERASEARQRNEQVLGRAALFLAGQIEMPTEEKTKTLDNTFRLAQEGDRSALETLVVNATSGVAEMVCKSGSEMIATAHMEHGHLTQYGRTTEERQFNTRTTFSHKFPGLDAMSKIEGQNAFLIEGLYNEGKLKVGDKVVEISLVPDEPYEALKGSGLFLREVVAIIRVTEICEGGQIKLFSYLVNGTQQNKLPPIESAKTKADEERIERLALKHRIDIAAARTMLSWLGVANADRLSPTDILGTMVHISAEAGIDGIDIAMAYDAAVAQTARTSTLMGSAELHQKIAGNRTATRMDYVAHFERIHELQRNLHEVGHRVARQCARRWREVAGDAYAAGRLMHALAEQEAVRHLARYLADTVTQQEAMQRSVQPDLTVFGIETYRELLAYEWHLRQGDALGAIRALERAEQKAQGTGCATGLRKTGEFDVLTGPEGTPDDEAEQPDTDKRGSRTFKCPFSNCKKENRRDYNELRTHCQHCYKKLPRCGDEADPPAEPAKKQLALAA